MSQLTFDLEALDDTRTHETYSCGTHEITRQAWAHWDNCLNNTCPRCGETSTTSYMAELNHGLIGWRMFCSKQIALLNHAARCQIILTGQWKHAPQTTCFGGHDHSDRKSGAHFSKGAPVECIQAEYNNCFDWLTTHRVDADLIGTLGAAHAQIERAA
jgi:hypothetical protein